MRGQSGLDDVASLLGIRVGTVGMAVSMSCRITLLWGPFRVGGACSLREGVPTSLGTPAVGISRVVISSLVNVRPMRLCVSSGKRSVSSLW